MRSDIQAAVLLIVATMMAACAGTPPREPQTGTAPQSQPATQTLAAVNNTPPTSPAAPAVPAPAVPTGGVDANLVKAGYSVMKRHGEVYYCRNEIITGQRIATRVCLTAEQIQDEKQNVTKAKDIMNQPSYQCLGASCSN